MEDYICPECVITDQHVHEIIPMPENDIVSSNIEPPETASLDVQEEQLRDLAEEFIQEHVTKRT